MQAFVDGKEIEFECDGRWDSVRIPVWNWDEINYRIKPQPKCSPYIKSQYVPYTDISEIQKNKWVAFKYDKNTLYPIKAIHKRDCVLINKAWYSLRSLFDICEYEDGTPCGKVVEK